MTATRARLRALPGQLKRSLDRPGRRWLLGGLVTAAFSASARRWQRVRWTGTEWSYRYDGQTILSNQLMPSATTFDDDLEIFLWDYTPARGDVILDIGAGTGSEAIRLARSVGPTGRVVAVEAHPATAAILAKAGPANHLRNITSIAAAIADAPGVLHINDDDEAGTNTLFAGGTIEVSAMTIDDLVDEQGLDRIAFLKMNIEGAERLAVLGMVRSAGRIDRMAISCHDFLGTEWGATKDEVRAWLEGQGFTVRSRPDDPRAWARDYLYATAPDRATPPSPPAAGADPVDGPR